MRIILTGCMFRRVQAVYLAVYMSVLSISSAGVDARPLTEKVVDLDRVTTFMIEPQGIESALIQFSRQAHIQVLISPRVNSALASAGLRGTVSARSALGTLLANTGLKRVTVGESLSITPTDESLSLIGDIGGSQRDDSTAPDFSKIAEDQQSGALQKTHGSQDSESGSSLAQGANASSRNLQLEEVVVTSRYQFLSADTSGTTNLPLPIERVPQSISIVSDDFIKAADLKTLGEIAEYTPGAINVGNPENTASQIYLRGFTAGQSIDGINVLGYGGLEPDFAIYDRLEVVKGPSSVVYGVGSPGGLVNYVTKSATDQTPDYVYAQAGSWNSYRLEGQIAGALDAQKHVRAIGIAAHDQGDSFMHGIYHNRTSIYGGLNIDFGNSMTAYLHGGYERQKVPSFDGTLAEPDGSPAPVPRSFFIGSEDIATTADVYHTEGGWTWHASQMMDVSVKGIYQTAVQGGAGDTPFGLQLNGDFGFGTSKIDTRNTNYGVGASSIYKLDDLGLKDSFVSLAALYQNNDSRSHLQYAFTGQANIFDGEASIRQAFNALLAGPLPDTFQRRTKAETTTVSAQSNLRVLDPLTLLLGVSYSKPKQSTASSGPPQEFHFAGKTSYRAGVTYEILPKTYGYFSFSQSFNPQTMPALGGGLLQPITGDQYEAGAKYRDASGRLLLTAAVFKIKEKNVAQYAATVNGVDFFRGAGEVTHKGLELQSIGRFTRQWEINAGYAYLDPKITADTDPTKVQQTELFRPKQTFSLYTTYTIPSGFLRGLSLGAGARYVSLQRTSYDRSTRDLPGYTLVDLNAGYTLDKWLVQLNAHNVLDRHYFINNYQSLFYGNVVGDPANVSLSVRWQF